MTEPNINSHYVIIHLEAMTNWQLLSEYNRRIIQREHAPEEQREELTKRIRELGHAINHRMQLGYPD